MRLLDTQPQNLAGLDRFERRLQLGHDGKQTCESVARRLERDDREIRRDRMLHGKQPIDGDERIVFSRCECQQRSVLDTGPPGIGNGRNYVP